MSDDVVPPGPLPRKWADTRQRPKMTPREAALNQESEVLTRKRFFVYSNDRVKDSGYSSDPERNDYTDTTSELKVHLSTEELYVEFAKIREEDDTWENKICRAEAEAERKAREKLLLWDESDDEEEEEGFSLDETEQGAAQRNVPDITIRTNLRPNYLKELRESEQGKESSLPSISWWAQQLMRNELKYLRPARIKNEGKLLEDLTRWKKQQCKKSECEVLAEWKKFRKETEMVSSFTQKGSNDIISRKVKRTQL